jgi:hypothetical protein
LSKTNKPYSTPPRADITMSSKKTPNDVTSSNSRSHLNQEQHNQQQSNRPDFRDTSRTDHHHHRYSDHHYSSRRAGHYHGNRSHGDKHSKSEDAVS